MPLAESLQRVARQPPIRIRAAEAPWPRARVAAGERALERLVEGSARSELAEDDLTPHVERSSGRAEDIDVPWMRRIRIGVQLQEVETERVRVPRPQVVRPRASERDDRRRVAMDEAAEPRYRRRQCLERQRAPDARAPVAVPLVHDEIGLVHELEREDLLAEVGTGASSGVAANERLDHPAEQRVVSFLRQQDARAPLRQARFEQITADGVRERVTDAAKQPVMIEQHEIEADAGAARDLEADINVGEELLVEAGRQAAVVVDDARAAVAEDEPARDDEAEARHLVEIALDRRAASGHAHM